MHRESLGNYWMTEDRLGLSLFSGGLYDDEFRLVIRIVTVTDYYDIMIARLSVKIWAGLGVLKVPKPEKDWMIELTFALRILIFEWWKKQTNRIFGSRSSLAQLHWQRGGAGCWRCTRRESVTLIGHVRSKWPNS